MMPEDKFLIVGGSYHHEFADFPTNLKYSGYQPDMREFYRQVKVLLVPSLVPEGFPRMILEAEANGIPVIAHNLGGIPEALGKGGILIDLDVTTKLDVEGLAHRYVAELRRLLDNADEYQTLSNNAFLRARQYDSHLEHDLRFFLQQHVP